MTCQVLPSARSKADEEKRGSNFRRLDAIISLSRVVPTIQLFDAIWQTTFTWLRQTCPKACEYLQETYFQPVSIENLQRQFRCNHTLWEASALWFAGFWSGIIGTYPGSSSGTQTLESFHSYWQNRIQAKARAKPTEIGPPFFLTPHPFFLAPPIFFNTPDLFF